MKNIFKLTLLSLTLSQSLYAQKIITDNNFPNADAHVILNTVDKEHLKPIYFNFEATNKTLIYLVRHIYTQNNDKKSFFTIQNDRDTFILNLQTGELTSNDGVIAYFCGNEKHFEESSKPVELPPLSKEELNDPTMMALFKSKYSMPCPSKEGFVLDKNVELKISFLDRKIEFTPYTESEVSLDYSTIQKQESYPSKISGSTVFLH